jgi:hypothetical protein
MVGPGCSRFLAARIVGVFWSFNPNPQLFLPIIRSQKPQFYDHCGLPLPEHEFILLPVSRPRSYVDVRGGRDFISNVNIFGLHCFALFE